MSLGSRDCFGILSRKFGIISLQIFKVQIVENGWASSTLVMEYRSCHTGQATAMFQLDSSKLLFLKEIQRTPRQSEY